MAFFWPGIFGIIIFYLVILAVGIWASRKATSNSEEEMMLAGRKLGLTVGALTLTATWVGGGYVNGASEVMLTRGLVWAQVPVGYSLSLFVGALFFVKPMRDLGVITLLDPFQQKYGDKVGGLLFIPAIFGDFFWVASILSALGSSLVVLTEIDPRVSVGVSAVFVAGYTSFGAMYAVTYTDVVQMFFIIIGLVLSIPFTIQNEHVHIEQLNDYTWLGEIEQREIWYWIDTMLLLILGGIPWQGYMQRVLSINSTRSAQILSTLSMVACALMATPAMFIGLVARTTDWEAIPSFNRTLTTADENIILPMVLRHLVPEWVAFFGLGAISAAVMSSADSSILAFSSTFSRNVYKNLFRAKASQLEIAWVLRATVLVITAASAVIALTIPSIYYLAVLSSDLIYVVLFPHLLLIVYMGDHLNSYGCVASFFLGCIVRILGGEPGLGIPAVIKYPNYDFSKNTQMFPHRTLAMLIVMVSHLGVSMITRHLFVSKKIPLDYDVLQVFPKDVEEEVETQACSKLLSSENEAKKKIKI